MGLLADLATALVALLHPAFLALEMFLWDKPFGLRVFRQTQEFARASRALAAGLAWGLIAGSQPFKIFFPACVIVAGAYGGWSVSRRILRVQAAPGAVVLALVLASG